MNELSAPLAAVVEALARAHRGGPAADDKAAQPLVASLEQAYAVQEHLLTGQLEHVLPGWRLFDVTIWLCMRTRKHVPAATRALADFLVSEYGGVDSDRWAVHHLKTPEVYAA